MNQTTMLALVLALFATPSTGFVMPYKPHTHTSTGSKVAALSSPAVAEGEREILDGPNGPILVTKVAGSCYAVDATCPHLGLPMKKGKVTSEGGEPTLVCNFHNSCFRLQDGKCTKWVTGALGLQNGLVAGIMSKVGSDQQDIKAYTVKEMKDGTLSIE